MTIRSPFSLRRYDLDDPEDLERLRKVSTYIGTPEGAWPLRGPRRRDKNPPPPPDNGRSARRGRPS